MTDRSPFSDRLALARAVIAELAAHPDDFYDRLPVWRRDQLQAAANEAHVNLDKTAPLLAELEPDRWDPAGVRSDEPTNEQSALLLAALIGCTPCWHLRRGDHLARPDVLLADLNHRLVLCRRCTGTHRRPVRDDRCEVCDSPVPDRRFHSFVIAVAAITYVGNAGGCCAAALFARPQPDQPQ